MSHVTRELTKTFLQKRTYVGWVGLFLIPFLLATAFYFSPPSGQQADQDVGLQIFLSITGNGLYLTVAVLAVLSTFLLPLLASMAGSFTIAGEAESHTLRTILMQPVRRGTLLAAKWFVANVYVAIGLLLVGAAALIAGGAYFGIHPLLLLSGGAPVGVGHALWLIFLSYLYILAAMVAVVSVAVLLSTVTNSSLTAAAAGLVMIIVMQILGSFSVFDFLRPYLITSHFDAWLGFLSEPIEWGPVWKGLINFAVWAIGTTGLAYYLFRRKDVLS